MFVVGVADQSDTWNSIGDLLLLGVVIADHGAARRPHREHVQAQPRREGLRQPSSRATAACSTASTASCSRCRRCTTSLLRPRALDHQVHARRGGSVRSLTRVDDHDHGAGRHRRLVAARSARRRSTSSAPSRTATRSSGSASGRRSTCSSSRPRVPAEGRRRRRSGRRAEVAAALPFAEVVDDLATSSTTPTSWSTPSSASPACRSPSPRCAPGKRLALANKESLIAAGPVVQPLRATPGAELVPVDSEHCAVHQCLRSSVDADREVAAHRAHGQRRAVPRPHRRRAAPTSRVDAGAGPSDVVDGSEDHDRLEHADEQGPRGDRGPRAVRHAATTRSRSSCTRSRVVHSMVEFTDGSTIAQLSMPDMRLPIGYALAYPAASRTPFGRIDWAQLGRLDFEPPDTATFRCLALAYAGRADRAAPRRRGSARPTRSPSRRSSPGGSAGRRSPTCATQRSHRHDRAGCRCNRRRHRRGRRDASVARRRTSSHDQGATRQRERDRTTTLPQRGRWPAGRSTERPSRRRADRRSGRGRSSASASSACSAWLAVAQHLDVRVRRRHR